MEVTMQLLGSCEFTAPFEIRKVAFNADGTQLAGLGTTLRIWDTASGNLLHEFPFTGKNDHGLYIENLTDICYIKDRWLLCSADGWQEISDGNISDFFPLPVIKFFSGSLSYIAAVLHGDEKQIHLLDRQGKEIRTLQGFSKPICSMKISPDESFLTAGSREGKIFLFNLKTGDLIDKAGCNLPLAIDISPDCATIVTGSGNGEVTFWSVPDLAAPKAKLKKLKGPGGKHEFVPAGGEAGVNGVAFDPEGRFAAAACNAHYLRLWPISGGSAGSHKLLNHTTSFNKSLAISPKGLIAAGGTMYRPGLFNCEATAVDKIHPGNQFSQISFSYDDRYLAVSNQLGLQIWDIETSQQLKVFQELAHCRFSWTADGTIITRDGDRFLKISPPFEKLETTGTFRFRKSYEFNTLYDGKFLAGAVWHDDMEKEHLCIVDAASLQIIDRRKISYSAITVAPDSSWIAVASEEKLIKFNVSDDGKLGSPEEIADIGYTENLCTDGIAILSGRSDTLAINLETKKSENIYSAKAFSSNGVCFLVDSKTGALSQWNKTQKPISFTDGDPPCFLEKYQSYAYDPESIALSPSKKLMAFPASNGQIIIRTPVF